MSDYAVLEAAVRDRAGKGAARAIRREGRVPGVIYGGGRDVVLLTMDPRVLNARMRRTGFFATQFHVDVAGEQHRVLPKDVQFHPVTDDPIHVDFLRVTDRTRVTVEIPVRFLNEEAAPGLEVGGVLSAVRHTVEVATAAGNIPEEITVDLAGMEIGDSVRIGSITLPEGVRPTIADRDFVIASIGAPTLIVEEEEDEDVDEDEDEMDVPTVAEDEAASEPEEDD